MEGFMFLTSAANDKPWIDLPGACSGTILWEQKMSYEPDALTSGARSAFSSTR